ncbi:MAG: type III-A CRISPR-associated RAMP protein Csm5 [Methanosarcina thermophila]|nr:type III-A CRISPR-associated RAMP protein Csm5 [Methanosarcina thermophila]
MTKLILETISPIHIGNGSSYSNAEFLSIGNTIHRMDINKIYNLLNEKEREKFVDYLEDQQFKLDDFFRGKSLSIAESKLYSLERKGQTPRGEIREHIKTEMKGYLPGSSLKGAIKTVVMNAFMDKKKIEKIGEIFDNPDSKTRNKEIQKFIEDIFSSEGKQSSYSDFMRFVQISDFIPVSRLCVSEVRSLEVDDNINRWYWYQRGGKIVQSFLETIEVGEKLEGEIHFTYNYDVHHSLGLKGKADILNIEEIKYFIFNFSAEIIKHEISFSKKYNIDFLLDFYRKLKKLNSPESPVIKLGHGAGYLGTTIGLEIKKENHEVFEQVRRSLRGRSYEFEFPKTRRIAVEENVPMGWCKIL